MKTLIVHGDPGIRKGAVIEYDGEEVVCFSVKRQGEYHGPERIQLWCTVGDETEREDYDLRNYQPHFLDVDRVDAADVTVLKPKANA